MTNKEERIVNAIEREMRTIKARNLEIPGLMAMATTPDGHRELKHEYIVNIGMLNAFDIAINKIMTA